MKIGVSADELSLGTQITYVPTHAEDDFLHPDCEDGFVTSVHRDGTAAFCRYWREDHSDLRTKANSELTPLDCLVLRVTQPEWRINRWLQRLGLVDV